LADGIHRSDSIGLNYHQECAGVVKKSTEAAYVYAFEHNVRRAADKNSHQRIRGGQQVRDPFMWYAAITPLCVRRSECAI